MGEFRIAAGAGMRRRGASQPAVGLAFGRALASQCHPRMLLLVFLPFIVALLGAIILLWLFWDPLTQWLGASALGWGLVDSIDQWMLAAGLFSVKLYLVPVLALGMLLPLAGLLGLLVAAMYIMPIVLRHLEVRQYPDVARKGRFSFAVSGWNAVWVTVLFVLGWLVTMPLWLLPPFPILLPLFWWAFAFSRLLRMDALVEHASGAERRSILRRYNGRYWAMGGLLALINLFPPAWLVLPVFSALVFAHFSLEALRQLRGDQGGPALLATPVLQ